MGNVLDVLFGTGAASGGSGIASPWGQNALQQQSMAAARGLSQYGSAVALQRDHEARIMAQGRPRVERRTRNGELFRKELDRRAGGNTNPTPETDLAWLDRRVREVCVAL